MAIRKKYRVGKPAASAGERDSAALRSLQRRSFRPVSHPQGSAWRRLGAGLRPRRALAAGAGQKKGKRLRRLPPLFGKALAIIGVLGFLSAGAAFIYFSKDIPDPSKISDRSVDQSTQIFDRTGEHLLYQIHGDEKRTVVELDQITPNLVKATIATEDKKFYSHPGIDLKGIVRAVYKDVISGEKAQGASTITQQLIKNSVLTSDKSYTRKIKEIILALETEQKFSKDEIMEMYLNQIPYGSNLYGAEVAAQTFFGKSAKDLDVAEAATLAAIPQSTTYYFPYGSHPDALETRRQYVIKEMFEDGYINQAQADEAKAVDIFARLKPFVSEIEAPHFVMYIKDQLVNQYGADTVERGGLKVYTTLDYDKQKIAEDAVAKGVAYNASKYQATNAALVATDPRTGQILAMVGGKDYFDLKGQGNVNVATSVRQPGSSFKPFVYATAFSKGYTPDTILFDVPTSFGPDGGGKEFEPKNYNLQYSGPVTIRSSLARSLNIPAVKALYLAGINDSLKTAEKMGISSLNQKNQYGLSLVLGTGEVRLLELTGAYGVFASEGQKSPLTGILKVEDAEGNTLQEYKPDSKQVLDPEVARNITSILADNAARTPTFGARSKLYFPGRPVAAKTGTTSDYKDAWTVGYTPSLSVGVWAGNTSGKAMNAGGGVSAATPIWNDFLTRALADQPAEQFTAPQPIVTKKAVLNGSGKGEVVVTVDKACGGGKLATEDTPEEQKEERTFYEVHSILYYVNKDDPQGEYPKHPQDDPQFGYWEAGVRAWAAANNLGGGEPAPTEYCNVRTGNNVPTVRILSPSDNEVVRGGKVTIEAEAASYFSIKQVEFYLDNNLLKIFTEEPYAGTFRLSGDLDDGIHTIRVKAYDNIGDSATATTSVIVNEGGTASGPSVYLRLAGSEFPVALQAYASGGADVKRVEFFYQLDSIYDSDMNLVSKPGASYKLGEASASAPGTDNLYQAVWEEDRDYFISGKYKIYALLTDKKNRQYRSNETYIEIK